MAARRGRLWSPRRRARARRNASPPICRRPGWRSRGALCHLTLPDSREGLERAPAALALVRDSLGVVLVPPRLLQAATGAGGLRAGAVVLRADLGRDRALTALAVRDLIGRGARRRGRQAPARLGPLAAGAVRRAARRGTRRPAGAVAQAGRR